MTVRRRSVLFGTAGLGAVLLGCSTRATPPARPPAPPSVEPRFAEIESRLDGRLGVLALDTGTGATVGHRADERFLLCSTMKVPIVAAILRRADAEPGLLDQVIRYGPADLLAYAPVTRPRVGTGMTVAELCAAAITVSDNTAANLLVATLGGPPAVTAFLRSLGDPVSRADRLETALNEAAPGDERDTTTPTWIARDLQALVLGAALPPAGRQRLTDWMLANTTGADQIRAGVPAGWAVADKTGSGASGESNDIGVVWPPGRAPIVVAVYTAPSDPASTGGKPAIAAATTAALAALGVAP